MPPINIVWVQSVVATLLSWIDSNCSAKTSAGVRNARTFRGRLFRARATASRSWASHLDRSVPLGKYWRRSPLLFSFVGRCQGECGSAKYTFVPVSRVNSAWFESSLPRSQVRVWRNCSGNLVIEVCRAVFIASAPYPPRAGPFLVGATLPHWGSQIGRASCRERGKVCVG